MTTSSSRRGQSQKRILVSAGAALEFEAAALAHIRASVLHLDKPASKKAVADAMIAVAIRHADEVTAELIRQLTPTDEDTNGDEQ